VINSEKIVLAVTKLLPKHILNIYLKLCDMPH